MENMQHHEKTKLLNYRHRPGGRILGYWHRPHLQQDDKNKTNKPKRNTCLYKYKKNTEHPIERTRKETSHSKSLLKYLSIQNEEKY